MIDYSEHISDVKEALEKVFRSLGVENYAGKRSFAAYVDVTIEGMWERVKLGGQVPCRSIWDGARGRLAAVMVYDSL